MALDSPLGDSKKIFMQLIPGAIAFGIATLLIWRYG
jgi:hypothetical protein